MITNPNLFSYFFVHFDGMYYEVHFWEVGEVVQYNIWRRQQWSWMRKKCQLHLPPLIPFFWALVVSILKRSSSMCRSMGLISHEIIDNGLTLALFCVGFDKSTQLLCYLFDQDVSSRTVVLDSFDEYLQNDFILFHSWHLVHKFSCILMLLAIVVILEYLQSPLWPQFPWFYSSIFSLRLLQN